MPSRFRAPFQAVSEIAEPIRRGIRLNRARADSEGSGPGSSPTIRVGFPGTGRTAPAGSGCCRDPSWVADRPSCRPRGPRLGLPPSERGSADARLDFQPSRRGDLPGSCYGVRVSSAWGLGVAAEADGHALVQVLLALLFALGAGHASSLSSSDGSGWTEQLRQAASAVPPARSGAPPLPGREPGGRPTRGDRPGCRSSPV